MMMNDVSGTVSTITKSRTASRLSVPTIPNSIYVERGDHLKKDSFEKTVPKKESSTCQGQKNKKATTGEGTGDSCGGVGGAHCGDGGNCDEISTDMSRPPAKDKKEQEGCYR